MRQHEAFPTLVPSVIFYTIAKVMPYRLAVSEVDQLTIIFTDF